MAIPKLYRGDSLPFKESDLTNPKSKGKTWADYYKTEGLMAKFNSGGDSKIWSLPLSYLIASHVGYLSDPDPKKVTPEELITNRSPFISFSSVEDKAFSYMDRSGKSKFEDVEVDDATHFKWALTDILNAVETQIGLYEFTYKASIKNVMHFLANDHQAILEEVSKPDMDFDLVADKFGELLVSAYTMHDTKVHCGRLINVEKYLSNKSIPEHEDLRLRAIERSARDSEWLLFPSDVFENGVGFESRFYLNDHLFLHHWAKKIR